MDRTIGGAVGVLVLWLLLAFVYLAGITIHMPKVYAVIDRHQEQYRIPVPKTTTTEEEEMYNLADYALDEEEEEKQTEAYATWTSVSMAEIQRGEARTFHSVHRMEFRAEEFVLPKVMPEQQALLESSQVYAYTRRLCNQGDTQQEQERGSKIPYEGTHAIEVLLARDGCVVSEKGEREDQYSFFTKKKEYFGRHPGHHDWNENAAIPRAMYVFTAHGNAWQHFVADFLPRVAIVGTFAAKMTVITPPRTQQNAGVLHRYFGVEQTIDREVVCAKELFFVRADPAWYYQCRSPFLVRATTKQFAAARTPSHTETVVYAGRPEHVARGLVENDALAEVVRRHAERYAPHARFVHWRHYGGIAMDSDEAWSVWSNVSLVVGPHGGSLANMIMNSAESVTMVEFVGTDSPAWGWNDIATAQRAEYWWILSPGKRHYESRYSVNPDMLKRLLEQTQWTKSRV